MDELGFSSVGGAYFQIRAVFLNVEHFVAIKKSHKWCNGRISIKLALRIEYLSCVIKLVRYFWKSLWIVKLICWLFYFTQYSSTLIIVPQINFKFSNSNLHVYVITNKRFQTLMSKSKSPKKDSAPAYQADPEMKERAKKALAQRSKKQQSFFDQYAYHIVFGILAVVMLGALIHSFWKIGPNVQKTDVNDHSYISEKNSMGASFEVGTVSMFDGYKLFDVKNVLNSQASNKQQLYLCNTGNKDTIVPQTYNFRKEYPNCARKIINQGNCSSSYSIAAVSAITDRWCRANDLSYPVLSAQGPLACDKAINNQCKGGYLSRTLDYAKIYGLVDQTCLGYNSTVSTPEQCQKQTASCQKHKIADYCVAKDLQNIKQQIFNNGPVVAAIPIYRDFLIYKKGLYQVYPRNQRFSTGQAVKIIGWDVRDGQTCWLVENSWGEDWGENGIACVLVNQDELQIERFTIAPALNTENIQGEKAQEEFTAQATEQAADEHQQL